MLTKRSIITALVGLNVFLMASLVLGVFSPPQAFAQRRGAASDYVAVTCRADRDYDALYIIDLPERALHCFVPNRDRSGRVVYGGARNLATDFER